MKRPIVVLLVAGVGIVLLVCGVFWNQLRPPESYWSQEKAQQYVQAFWKLHGAQDRAAHLDAELADESLKATRERYNSMTQELDQARSSREQTGKLLAIAGLILLLVAVMLRGHILGK